jgi:hypothetical protein
MPRLIALIILASNLYGQTLPRTLKELRSLEDAQEAELALQGNPKDNKLAGALLDFYLGRWTDEKLHAARAHYLQWIIANRPDIDPTSTINDTRALLVSPDDKETYPVMREAWLRQVARQPNNARVLLNAARCLRLTDREMAANWLKTAANYDTDSSEYRNSLAVLYADALTGIAAMSPFEEPTRLDPDEPKSLFARQVKEEAMQDSILGAITAWQVHLIAMSLRGSGLTTYDYDNLAEELLINAANLDYPKPAKVPYLAQFYRDQSLKVDHKLKPKFPEIEVKPQAEAKELVDYAKKIYSDTIDKPVKVPLNVLIGMDGHVWNAVAPPDAPDGGKDLTTRLAASSLLGWTFKPLRVSGEPVQVVTSFLVTVEPQPPPEKKKVK